MTVSPEIASRLTSKVAAMTMQERAEHAAQLVDLRSPREEDDLEFAKLICGSDAGTQELIDLILNNGGIVLSTLDLWCNSPSIDDLWNTPELLAFRAAARRYLAGECYRDLKDIIATKDELTPLDQRKIDPADTLEAYREAQKPHRYSDNRKPTTHWARRRERSRSRFRLSRTYLARMRLLGGILRPRPAKSFLTGGELARTT